MIASNISHFFFQVTRDNIVLDATLLAEFSKAVQNLQPGVTMDMIERIHVALLDKIYNVRSNEFLHNVSKTDCIKQGKAVDANIGLRDTLKSYAVKKQSHV